jgi:hypothetical protein
MTHNKFKNKLNISEIIDPWKKYQHIEAVRSSKISILQNYRKTAYFPFLPRFSFQRKSDILVIGLSLFYKLSPQLQKKSHIVIRPRDLFKYKANLFKLLNNITFDLSIYKKIFKQLISNEKYNYNYIEKIIHKVQPNVLIIASTIDPIQRLWAYYAGKNKIKVICIQHGMFSSINAPEALEENIVDYYFSISKKQSKLIEKVIPKKKFRILNSENFFTYRLPKKNEIRICLIGNDYERYGAMGKKLKKITLKIYDRLLKIIEIDRFRKYKIFYKRHPAEEWTGDMINKVTFTDLKKSDEIDIFFGVSSTLLANLASERRCVIQIISKDLRAIRYEDYGACKTMDIEYLEKSGLRFLNEKKIIIPFLELKNFNHILTNILKN